MVEPPRREEVKQALSSQDCPFSGMSDEVRDQLATAMEVRQYDPGAMLLRQGAPGDSLFVVIEGFAEVLVRRAAETDTSAIGQLKPGDLAGEMSLVTDEPRNADIICRTPVRAAMIAAKRFADLTRHHPELLALLTEVVADRFGRSMHDGLTGKVVNGYRIERCVGRGGMGIVYEASQLPDLPRVALKMMNHRLLFQPKAIQRFQREADTLRKLSHQAIARLYGRFGAYRTQFLVMEFCEGATLGSVLSSYGSLPEQDVRGIVGQLAQALSYVHDKGLTHQDLKPSNVMLSAAGTVKLLDFGLVSEKRDPRVDPTSVDTTIWSELSSSIAAVGTPRYMAPEQFGCGAPDHRVDWYGLACIAYEALTGRPVIESSGLLEIVQEQQQFVLGPASEIGPGISDSMRDLLAAGLERRPEVRRVDLKKLSRWASPFNLPKQVNINDGGVDSATATRT